MKRELNCRTTDISCCDEVLTLHPQKVIYWAAKKTLFAADIHLGKEHAFGRAGIAIPTGSSEATLASLMQLVDDFAAERLIILGDLLHATPHRDESWQPCLQRLINEHKALDIKVIIGNHDSSSARKNVVPELSWLARMTEPPFVFMHEPKSTDDGYVLAGHLHPVWRLHNNKRRYGGRRNPGISAPVFWFQDDVAVLPSFGHFTGGHTIKAKDTDRLFMTGPDCVIEVPRHA